MNKRILGTLAIICSFGLFQDPVLEKRPLEQPTIEQSKEKKPTTIVVGHPDGVRVFRNSTIGTVNHLYNIEDGSDFGQIRLMGIGVRPHNEDYQEVTMEEYGAWLAAGSPEDVDGFLESIR